MHIKIANSDDLNKVAPLFDAYRVFYGQKPNLETSSQFLEKRHTNNEIVTFLATNTNG